MTRPTTCPDCGASTTAHTGTYCHDCGATLTPEPPLPRARRQDHGTGTVEAAARFEADRHPSVRVGGRRMDPDDVPSRDEL